MSDCDDGHIKANAAYQAEDCPTNVAHQNWGGLIGASGATIDHQQMLRDQRIQSAIWALNEARRVRGDVELMADVRAWVREKRQEFMLFLDDLGD